MPNVDSSLIPPIEIGTFDAFHPQNSEFIGSSSGVFFVNTVFRAFGKLNHTSTPDEIQSTGSIRTASVTEYLGTVETSQDAIVVDPLARPDGHSKENTYKIDFLGLGEPPEPNLARELVMLYFQHWHPFFPFLHGPTFFDSVSSFLEGIGNSLPNEEHEKGRRTKLCRAVTFQCVFNLAASAHSQELPASCRIQSPSALIDTLGSLSAGHDLASLQALVAAELYLVTIMSLRAASTIHGILTRLIFHSGLHRCPFRYVQLPPDVCEMRKRILWSTYTLDRYLSQSLGHPLGLQDSDIDVCVPGVIELHKPVTIRHDRGIPQSSTVEDVQSHMPGGTTRIRSTDIDDSVARSSASPTVISGDRSGPARSTIQPNAHGGQWATVHLQEYFVSYSQLVAEALELFHKSLHARSITHNKIMELTYKVNLWWNGLPNVFQEDEGGDDKLPGSKPSYVAFFTISYHYLLILINRPFLSLRTDTIDFRSSLQRAIGASRGVVTKLKHIINDPFLMTWPAIHSAAWMAGLVLAYASLVDMYPLNKAKFEITKCLEILKLMGHRWGSARHCHHALKALLARLDVRAATASETLSPSLEQPQFVQPEATTIHSPVPDEARGAKRPRLQENELSEPNERRSVATSEGLLNENVSAWPNWMPILQYNGPDFGFDALHYGVEEDEGQLMSDFNISSMGLFDDMGWNSSNYGFRGN